MTEVENNCLNGGNGEIKEEKAEVNETENLNDVQMKEKDVLVVDQTEVTMDIQMTELNTNPAVPAKPESVEFSNKVITNGSETINQADTIATECVEIETPVENHENSEFREKKLHYEHESEDLSQEVQSSQLTDTQTSDTSYFHELKLLELSRYSWRSSVTKQRFLRGCLWSPDGTCVLTVVNSDGMHVVEMPQDLYQSKRISQDRALDVLQSAVHVKEAGVVYDYCWYPFMNSCDPSTCL